MHVLSYSLTLQRGSKIKCDVTLSFQFDFWKGLEDQKWPDNHLWVHTLSRVIIVVMSFKQGPNKVYPFSGSAMNYQLPKVKSKSIAVLQVE